MANYHVGWRSWVEQQTGDEQNAMAEAFGWWLQILPRESQVEEPLGWNQGEPTGLCSRKLFGEAPRAIFVTNVDAFLSLSYRPIHDSS